MSIESKYMKYFEKINKIGLPASILIASVIIGGFVYASQISKQFSIEKQQLIEKEIKEKQENRDYAAKQKVACMDIYSTEGKKWNNVTSWNYDAEKDECVITYKDPNKKAKITCEKDFADMKEIYKGEQVPISVIVNYLECIEGVFTKRF